MTNDRPGAIRLGGPVRKASVTLRVSGPNLDPAEITKGLGCDPTYTHLNGDAIPSTSNVRKAGMWMLELEGGRLEDQLTQLAKLVRVDLAIWKEVVRGLDVDVFCGLYLETENEGIEIEPTLLTWLGERGLSLGFDIYLDPDDDDEPEH